MALTLDKSGTTLSVVFDSLIADYNVLHRSLNDFAANPKISGFCPFILPMRY